MSTAFVLLPDFLLIVVGFLICRYTPLDRPVWGGGERLVYYVLVPVLLFNSIVRQPLLRDAPGLAAALLAIRHAVLPALAILLVLTAALTTTQRMIVVAFAALAAWSALQR